MLHQLDNRSVLGVPFEERNKDYPLETAKHMKQHVVSRKRGDFHQDWASKLLKHISALIEGLDFTRWKQKCP